MQVVPVVVVKTEAQEEQVQQVTQVVLAASQDQTQCPAVDQQMMEQMQLREVHQIVFMRQALQQVAKEEPLVEAEKQC